MTELAILILLLLIVIFHLYLENYFHLKRLKSIPIRIHVNGTRGKSSVTRLIAAGLRAGGIVTSAKTTGTLPRMILPDGTELPVYRKARANIIEQIRIVRHAVNYSSHALVIECMALQPNLQWLSEDKLIKATHGVITNIRPDHLEVMGPEEKDVALALAGMIPIKGKLFTGEKQYFSTLKEFAEDRNSVISQINSDSNSVTAKEMKGFRYMEHAENVSLALAVCENLGVKREIALQGMQKMPPDPGATSAYKMNFFNKEIIFVNGFAANDPLSTEKIWNMSLEKFAKGRKKIALVNCRNDRPERSHQLGEACAGWIQPDVYCVTGTGTHIFARTAAYNGVQLAKIVMVEDSSVTELFEKLIEISGQSSVILGLGNIGDNGLDIVRYFKNRSINEELGEN